MSKNTNNDNRNKTTSNESRSVKDRTTSRSGNSSRNSMGHGSARQSNNRQGTARSGAKNANRQTVQARPSIPKPGSNIRTVVRKRTVSPAKLGIAITIAVIMIIGFILINSHIDKMKAQKCVPVDNTDHLIGVENMEIKDGVLKLSGYCFKNGIDTVETKQFAQVMVILMNMDDENEKYFMDSSITRHEKLNEMFPLKFTDYVNGGFEAKIKTSKLDIEQKNYEILFSKMDYAWDADGFCKTGIRSGYSIVNGKLVNNN